MKRIASISLLSLSLLSLPLVAACGESGPDPMGTGAAASGGGLGTGSTGALGTGGSGSDAATASGVAAKYAAHFPIGAAVNNWHLDNLETIIKTDFNHLTAENAMKIQDIHPAETTWNYVEADRIADFARANGMKITGHTLLWHRQAPAWMFAGLTAEEPASIEILKGRMKAHIDAMIERYADVVDNWDVVNEAISDDAAVQYRAADSSNWQKYFGNEDYIYWAFQYAHDALEAKEPGSSAGKLYYNEYTVTVKYQKILKMLEWLKGKGITVAGVGFQSHENMSWPSTTDLQTAIDAFATAGYKSKISELDVTVYSDYSTGSFVASPAVAFTQDLETQQAARFASLFELYRANKANITSVTFWGISDDRTWLDNEPVAGRDDYPLLYDAAHEAKDARAAILNF